MMTHDELRAARMALDAGLIESEDYEAAVYRLFGAEVGIDATGTPEGAIKAWETRKRSPGLNDDPIDEPMVPAGPPRRDYPGLNDYLMDEPGGRGDEKRAPKDQIFKQGGLYQRPDTPEAQQAEDAAKVLARAALDAGLQHEDWVYEPGEGRLDPAGNFRVPSGPSEVGRTDMFVKRIGPAGFVRASVTHHWGTGAATWVVNNNIGNSARGTGVAALRRAIKKINIYAEWDMHGAGDHQGALKAWEKRRQMGWKPKPRKPKEPAAVAPIPAAPIKVPTAPAAPAAPIKAPSAMRRLQQAQPIGGRAPGGLRVQVIPRVAAPAPGPRAAAAGRVANVRAVNAAHLRRIDVVKDLNNRFDVKDKMDQWFRDNAPIVGPRQLGAPEPVDRWDYRKRVGQRREFEAHLNDPPAKQKARALDHNYLRFMAGIVPQHADQLNALANLEQAHELVLMERAGVQRHARQARAAVKRREQREQRRQLRDAWRQRMLGPAVPSAPSKPSPPPLPSSRVRDLMQNGKITSLRPVEIGNMNPVYRVHIEGRSFALKPTPKAAAARPNIASGRDEDHEVAVWNLNKAISKFTSDGKPLVKLPEPLVKQIPNSIVHPPEARADLRGKPVGHGMLAPWIKGKDHVRYDSQDPEQVRKMGLFDAIIGNEDRHGNNAKVTRAGQLIALDHGNVFPTNKAIGGFNLGAMKARDATLGDEDLRVLRGMQDHREELSNSLKANLQPNEMAMMWHRVDKMVETGKLYGYPWPRGGFFGGRSQWDEDHAGTVWITPTKTPPQRTPSRQGRLPGMEKRGAAAPPPAQSGPSPAHPTGGMGKGRIPSATPALEHAYSQRIGHVNAIVDIMRRSDVQEKVDKWFSDQRAKKSVWRNLNYDRHVQEREAYNKAAEDYGKRGVIPYGEKLNPAYLWFVARVADQPALREHADAIMQERAGAGTPGGGGRGAFTKVRERGKALGDAVNPPLSYGKQRISQRGRGAPLRDLALPPSSLVPHAAAPEPRRPSSAALPPPKPGESQQRVLKRLDKLGARPGMAIGDVLKRKQAREGAPAEAKPPSAESEPGSSGLHTFISKNREEIDKAISNVVGKLPEDHDDSNRRQWILNDQGLYNWARRSGVRI